MMKGRKSQNRTHTHANPNSLQCKGPLVQEAKITHKHTHTPSEAPVSGHKPTAHTKAFGMPPAQKAKRSHAIPNNKNWTPNSNAKIANKTPTNDLPYNCKIQFRSIAKPAAFFRTVESANFCATVFIRNGQVFRIFRNGYPKPVKAYGSNKWNSNRASISQKQSWNHYGTAQGIFSYWFRIYWKRDFFL